MKKQLVMLSMVLLLSVSLVSAIYDPNAEPVEGDYKATKAMPMHLSGSDEVRIQGGETRPMRRSFFYAR